mmetsp:Transcript_42059/g.109528  ORF Transcript_42059/g.109528 Transcript_42059/m.109528 type:complete len:212 (+) Transcript_42059:100-735(+)
MYAAAAAVPLGKKRIWQQRMTKIFPGRGSHSRSERTVWALSMRLPAGGCSECPRPPPRWCWRGAGPSAPRGPPRAGGARTWPASGHGPRRSPPGTPAAAPRPGATPRTTRASPRWRPAAPPSSPRPPSARARPAAPGPEPSRNAPPPPPGPPGARRRPGARTWISCSPRRPWGGRPRPSPEPPPRPSGPRGSPRRSPRRRPGTAARAAAEP